MPVSLKKGIFLIMLANLLNLIIGLMNGFVLPKFLSVETYAMIKTYTLYSTYAGFFHLGYLDGMYLKYGGKNMLSVDASEYGKDFWNVIFMQVGVGVILAFVGIIIEDFIVFAFSIGLFLRNVTSCYQMFFQATGEFKLYSSALNYGTILSFVVSMLLVFVFHTDNYKLYIIAQIAASFVVVLYLGTMLNKRLAYFRKPCLNVLGFKENIRSGFVLMIGNFSNNLFTSIDRWLVKILMTTFHFAAYSFAVSIDALITVFITPLYVTLYNSFCKDHSPKKVKDIKRLVLMWGFVLAAFAFPAKLVVENFLDKYIAAMPLIFVLFSTQAFYAVIKGVYVNYFKALKRQTQYFWQIMMMLVVAIVSSLLLYFLFKTMMALAVAALLTAAIWLLVNEYKYSELRYTIKDWIYIFVLLGIYLFSGLYLPTIWGTVLYLLSLILMSVVFMKKQTMQLLGACYAYVHRIILI